MFNFLSEIYKDESAKSNINDNNLTIFIIILFILFTVIAIQFLIDNHKINKLKERVKKLEEKKD